MSESERPVPRLPDDVVKRVLERAAELDATSQDGVSELELRQAAREAGISEASVVRALEEMRVSPRPAQLPEAARPAGGRSRFARVRLALVSMLTGGATALLFPGPGALLIGDPTRPLTIGMILMFALSLRHAVIDEDSREFQLSNATIWAGFLMGCTLIGRYFVGDTALPIIAAAFVASAAGSLLRWVRGRGHAAPTESPVERREPA